MILLEVFLLALAAAPVIVAQVANCTDSKFTWTYNSLGQCPCSIAMTLSQPCGAYTFGPLTPGQEYTPAQANNCTCNTVRYSLVSACAACQDGGWYTFSNYSASCTQRFMLQYPETIPDTTRVPHWAYLPLTPNGTFDIDAAMSAGGAESTAPGSAASTPASTSTSASETTSNISLGTSTRNPTSAPTSTSSNTSSSDTSSSSSKSNAGAIAGGVVGGVGGAALIAALAFWFYKQRNTPTSGQASVRGILASPPPLSWTPNSTPTMYQTPLRPYDPDDPSTFPPTRDQLMQMNQPSTASLPSAAPRYTGRPELF